MGETPACTNCHGATSSGKLFGMTLFSDIGHTPEQTGGFSEDDLTNAFYNATIPDGGTFDQHIVPYCVWHQIHLWRDIDTPEKQAGMRAYLRSLTPQEQAGCFELFKAERVRWRRRIAFLSAPKGGMNRQTPRRQGWSRNLELDALARAWSGRARDLARIASAHRGTTLPRGLQ